MEKLENFLRGLTDSEHIFRGLLTAVITLATLLFIVLSLGGIIVSSTFFGVFGALLILPIILGTLVCGVSYLENN